MNIRMPVWFLAAPILASQALSYGFFDNYGQVRGTVLPAPAAWSMAHCGTRALPGSGSFGLFCNPSDLPAGGGLVLGASGSLATWSTSTQFDGFMTSDRIVSDRSAGPADLALSGSAGGLAFGAGLARVSDFEFYGHVDVQDTTTTGIYFIDGVERLDSDGDLWEAVAGAAGDPAAGVRIGASFGLRFGDGSSVATFLPADARPPQVEEAEWSESAFCSHAGLQVRKGSVLLAASMDSGSDRYPWRFNTGAQVAMGIMGGSILGAEAGLSRLEGRTSTEAEFFLETGSIYSEAGRTVYSIGMMRPEDYARAGLCGSLGQRLHMGAATLDMFVMWTSRILNGSRLPIPFITEDSSTATFLGLALSTRL